MSERSSISLAEVLGENYYIDKLTSSDYSPSVGDTVTITLLVKDVFGDPANGQTRTVTCTGGSFVSVNGSSITSTSSVEVTTGSGGTVTLGLSVSVVDNIIVSDGRCDCVVCSLSNSITNLEYDTDWQTLTITNGKFAHYDNNAQLLQIRKVGRIVELTGSLKNTASITLNATEVNVATIPTEYRPTKYIFGLMQGSTTSVFLVTIKMDGALNVSRYRTSTTYSSVATGSWFPIHLTWII